MTIWLQHTTLNFTIREMACKCRKCGGHCDMKQSFMDKLQIMRDIVGPIRVSRGFSCPLHPLEETKPLPGSHTQGTAADLLINSAGQRFFYVDAALKAGMEGIGVYETHIHVDSGHETAARPALW